jgi:trimethylamine--corrinoid protein Co-methyltransferase
VQAGHEKTLTALLPALAGANLIYGAGMTESGVTFDPAQLVIDDEIARMVLFTLGGVKVDDDSLAIDDIHAVGPFQDFLSLDATMRHMREQSQPVLFDRRVREEWTGAGSVDAYEAARRRACEIIEGHRPLPVEPEVAEAMHDVVEAADREVGVD